MGNLQLEYESMGVRKNGTIRPLKGSVTIGGITETVQDLLAGMDKATSRNVLQTSLKDGGAPILQAIRSNAPVAARRGKRRGGTLKAGLKLRFGKGDRPGRTSVLIQSITSMTMYAKRTQNPTLLHRVSLGEKNRRYRVYYAWMVEKGHATTSGGRVDPNPFAARGFDSTVDESGEMIEKQILENATRVFAG